MDDLMRLFSGSLLLVMCDWPAGAVAARHMWPPRNMIKSGKPINSVDISVFLQYGPALLGGRSLSALHLISELWKYCAYSIGGRRREKTNHWLQV